MQFQPAIAKKIVPPAFAIGLFIGAYVTEKGTSRQDKDRARMYFDRMSDGRDGAETYW
jgi:hypothetical protein